MFIVHGCCPSCDLFGVHFSFSIYSILSSLLLLISISKFSVDNSYLIFIPFQMGTNRAICECPCGLHISDRWNFTTKRARSNLHTFALRKGKGFLTYFRWRRSIIPVNMTYVKLSLKLLGSVLLNCFEPIRKIIFVLEIWNILRKAGNWLIYILHWCFYKINRSFPLFSWSYIFSNCAFFWVFVFERLSCQFFQTNCPKKKFSLFLLISNIILFMLN